MFRIIFVPICMAFAISACDGKSGGDAASAGADAAAETTRDGKVVIEGKESNIAFDDGKIELESADGNVKIEDGKLEVKGADGKPRGAE